MGAAFISMRSFQSKRQFLPQIKIIFSAPLPVATLHGCSQYILNIIINYAYMHRLTSITRSTQIKGFGHNLSLQQTKPAAKISALQRFHSHVIIIIVIIDFAV